MADYPAIPLFTDAYLADTTHLTDAEHGVYFQLLMHAWRSPGCRLPNDHAWLARKLRRSVEDLEKTVMPVLREFWKCDGNWWVQKRLAREFEFVRKNAKRQSARAKSRWEKEKDACREDAALHASGNAPTPTPTPTPQKEKEQQQRSTPLPREPDRPQNAAATALLNEVAGSICARYALPAWTPKDRTRPSIEIAGEWAAAGMTPGRLREIVDPMVAKARERPNALGYFDSAVREAMAGAITPTARPKMTAEQLAESYREQFAKWAAGGPWIEGGLPPDEDRDGYLSRNPLCPQSVVDQAIAMRRRAA